MTACDGKPSADFVAQMDCIKRHSVKSINHTVIFYYGLLV